MDKSLSLDEIMQLLNNELIWCIDNKDSDSQFTREYKEGFIRGVNQAKYLIMQLAELDMENWWNNTIMVEWIQPEERENG